MTTPMRRTDCCWNTDLEARFGTWWAVEVRDQWGWRYLDWARFTTAELALAHHATLTETRPMRVVECPADNDRRTA